MCNNLISENKNEHNWAYIALILTNLLIYVAMLGFNGAATVQISGSSKNQIQIILTKTQNT